MEIQKQKPRSPLRSVKLFIRHQATPRQYFEAHVVESMLVGEKIESRISDKIETMSPTELAIFMTNNGVPQNEIVVAGQVMAQMEHNCANFGWFGGFLFSFSDEPTQ